MPHQVAQKSAPWQCCCRRQHHWRWEHRMVLPSRRRFAPSPPSEAKESRARRLAVSLHLVAQQETPWEGAATDRWPLASKAARPLPPGGRQHPRQLRETQVLSQHAPPPQEHPVATARRARPNRIRRVDADLLGVVRTVYYASLVRVEAPAPQDGRRQPPMPQRSALLPAREKSILFAQAPPPPFDACWADQRTAEPPRVPPSPVGRRRRQRRRLPRRHWHARHQHRRHHHPHQHQHP